MPLKYPNLLCADDINYTVLVMSPVTHCWTLTDRYQSAQADWVGVNFCCWFWCKPIPANYKIYSKANKIRRHSRVL